MKLSSSDAIVREDVSQPLATWKVIALQVLLVLCVIGFITMQLLFKPVRAAEAFLMVAVATLPVWWFMGLYLYRSILPRITHARRRRSLLLLIFVGPAFATIALAYVLNATLDHSAEEVWRVPILRSYAASNKRGMEYHAVLEPVTPSRLTEMGLVSGDFSLDKKMEIALSGEEYEALLTQTAQAVVVTRQGYLGIPWVKQTSLEFK